jgi:5-(carboxyamino)imidazole ribonucleotide mutase
MLLVAVVMGSKSDSEAIQPCIDILSKLGIEHEVNVISAHRTPEKARQFGQSARSRGIEVIIAAAGGAAHLPGVMASWTTIPVIGVPIPSGELKGVDALCAKNAAFLAAEILGLKHNSIYLAYEKYRQEMAAG